MPFDSEGNFTRIHNWEDDRINDIDIVTDHHDEEDDNFADGLTQTFLRDGRSAMKGDINVAGYKVKNLGNGTADYDAVNRGQLDNSIDNLQNTITEIFNSLHQLGDIKASVQSENHGSWFLCDGQEINRVTYSELFAIIGTKFGAGDGTTTFNLPDYRGKFLRGLGGDSASDIYTTQAEGLPNITAGFNFRDGSGDIGVFHNLSGAVKGSSNSGIIGRASLDVHGGSSGVFSHLDIDASEASSIYGTSEHVTPLNQAVNYFIKVKKED